MRALVKSAAGPASLALTDLPERSLQPHELRLELIFAGVCHTDVSMLAGAYDACEVGYRPDYPLVMGHEFLGRVVEKGSATAGFDIGDRVFAGCHLTCRGCRMCRAGRSMLCPQRSILGLDRDGAFSERFVIPALIARRVPDGLSDRRAALAEPFAVAAHAVDLASITDGERVAVVGPGTVGLLTIGALCGRDVTVFGTSGDAAQLAIAERLGASVAGTIDSDVFLSAAATFDVVIETAGHSSAVGAGLRLLAPGGRLVCVGLPATATPVRTADLAFTEQRIVGSRGYDLSTWDTLGERLATATGLEELVSRTLPFERFGEAVPLIQGRVATKVLLHP